MSLAATDSSIDPALYADTVPEIGAFVGPYRFLSNFYPAPTLYEGIVYPTAEHAYQAAKTLDLGVRSTISRLSTPGRAKHAGGMLPSVRADWNAVRAEVMREIVREKFGAEELRDRLAETWPAQLIEGNGWHDRFWGVCGCNRCKGAGDNRLGKVLMHLRLEGIKVRDERR